MSKKGKSVLIDPLETRGTKELLGGKKEEVQGVKSTSFAPVKQKVASGASDPFVGYPMEKIEVSGVVDTKTGKPIEQYATYIVGLTPSAIPVQDRSGKGVTTVRSHKKVDIESSHSRIVKDALGRNFEIVFDRDFETEDGKTLKFALIPNHLMRAQCIFKIIKGKVRVDTRYVLLDTEQASRLRTLFSRFNYQELKHERDAKAFDSEPESREE